ncbi:G2/mitotic-specific cyclin-B1-like isoform X4 [Heterodontus francisci]|uniref:G2/mitotic-specific cyclin-B1-like isoform X4 n=1 Tax=Heterodontus francisci TaxID=7792 RepID=UPI00355C476D
MTFRIRVAQVAATADAQSKNCLTMIGLERRVALVDILNKPCGTQLVLKKEPTVIAPKMEKNVVPKMEQVKMCKQPEVLPPKEYSTEDVVQLEVPPSPMDISVCMSEELCEAFSNEILPIEDVDINDDNPMLCSEYVKDVYKYLRELETKQAVRPNYLMGQMITGAMRAILIDWLVQVQIKFKLLPETLYLTVSVLDRFLQVSTEQHALAKYLMELTMGDYEMVHYPPSLIAAAAFHLAQKLFNRGEWTPLLQYYLAYSEDELLPVMQHMAKNVVQVNNHLTKHMTVKNKYARSRQMKISTILQLTSVLIFNLSKPLIS